jgi:hypothetical protein
MSNLYAAHRTFINKVMTLTPSQFSDKVDLFYDDLVADDRVLAVNISTDSNVDVDVHVIVDVPEGVDAQDYFTNTINGIVERALDHASLSVTAQVAERVPMLQH